MSAASANSDRVGQCRRACQASGICFAVSAGENNIPRRTVMKQTFGMFFAMCALAAMPALAQTKPAPSKTPPSKPAAAQHANQAKGAGPDAAFAKEAAVGGMAEVELGNLAKEKASNNDVK